MTDSKDTYKAYRQGFRDGVESSKQEIKELRARLAFIEANLEGNTIVRASKSL